MPVRKDVTDFLPDALAIQHASLPFYLRHAISLLGILFLSLLIFFFFMKIDIIVSAQGKLVSDHPTVMLKPLERTVIKEICVKVGERVTKNQILATFDPVINVAERDRLAAEVKRLQAQYSRMECEMKGEKYELTGKNDAENELQYKIFNDRIELYNNRISQYDGEIKGLEHKIESLRENIVLQEKRLKKFTEIESMLRRAGVSRAVSDRDLKDAEIQRMQLQAEISDKKHAIEETESQLSAKKNESLAFKNNWQVDLGENFTQTASDLTRTRKELAQASQMAEYVELRSPEDAVIHEIAPISQGSAIREAETLFTLVPTGGTLEVEVEIKAEDIGRIKLGDTAKIKISAFPFQKYGTIPGIVRVISEDSFSRQAEGGTGQPGVYYRAYIEFKADAGKEWAPFDRLIPGMEAQADIQTGRRSILEYIIHPIIKSLDEAIREP